MLTISVPISEEKYDEENNRFFFDEVVLELEHSLVALSKWEEKYEKAFLGKNDLTNEEILYYIECMVVTPEFPPEVFSNLTSENLEAITEYINAKMTATWFRDTPTKPSRETITAELIYYWMISLDIPIEWEHRHLNKLFTLIRVFNAKNAKPTKKSPAEAAAERRELNARRRAEYGTSG